MDDGLGELEVGVGCLCCAVREGKVVDDGGGWDRDPFLDSEPIFCVGVVDVAAGFPAGEFQFEEVVEGQPAFGGRDSGTAGSSEPDAAQGVDVDEETTVRGRFAGEALRVEEEKGGGGSVVQVVVEEGREEPFWDGLEEERRQGDGIARGGRDSGSKPRQEDGEGRKGIQRRGSRSTRVGAKRRIGAVGVVPLEEVG